MTNETPLFLKQVKVEVEKGCEMSTPLTERTLMIKAARKAHFNMNNK